MSWCRGPSCSTIQSILSPGTTRWWSSPDRQRLPGHLGAGVQPGTGRPGPVHRLHHPGVPARRGVLDRRAGRRGRPCAGVGAPGAGPGGLRCLGGRPDHARPGAGALRHRGGHRYRPDLHRQRAGPPGRSGPARAAGSEPARARCPAADHGQRGGHAAAGAGLAARPPGAQARGLPRDGHGPLPRRALHGPQ